MAVTLYRCRTPTNFLCPCGRVERALRRQAVDHATVRLDRRDRSAVIDVTGQRHVPVLDIEAQAIADSRRIVEHLRWHQGVPEAAGGRAR